VAGWIVADQNHGQPWCCRQIAELICDIVEKKLGLFAPVYDFRRHGTSAMKWCPGARQSVSALPDGYPSKRQLRGRALIVDWPDECNGRPPVDVPLGEQLSTRTA
jgi:hypothetical protein